jgi:hypothetical protein
MIGHIFRNQRSQRLFRVTTGSLQCRGEISMRITPLIAGAVYDSINHHEPRAPIGELRPKSECAFCHIASAKKDDAWTQFYPRLAK